MSTFLALDGPTLRRIDEALEKAGISRRAISSLRGLLVTIGGEIYRGAAVFYKLKDLCRSLQRCEKTIRTWLDQLHRAGVLLKRRAGPKGLEVQLQAAFIRERARAKPSLDPRREQAIELRLAEMGKRARSPEALRRFLRQKLSEEEITEILARHAPEAKPEAEAEASEAKPDALLEAARWRVEEKKAAPGFTGFHCGEQSYLAATRKQLAGRPDQVRAILERKKAIEEDRAREAEKKRRLAALAAEAAARAVQEREQEKALLKTFAERPEAEQQAWIERAISGLPRNIRKLRADHPTRLEQLEARLLKLLKPKAPGSPARDLKAELAQRLARRRLGSAPVGLRL